MAIFQEQQQTGDYRTRIVTDLGTVPAAQWDALLTSDHPAPFMRHAFLHALQRSGCVGAGTGWLPEFVCLEDPCGTLRAAAPLYLKTHSYGEFVFDWAWAQAYEDHRLPYYPKGVLAAPFSPVPGPRLLARDTPTRQALLAALQQHGRQRRLSSLHVLFPDEADRAPLEQAGLLVRRGVQFHWFNQHWPDFDAFLGSLTQPKRKNIRAERRKVAQTGIRTQVVTGTAITQDDLALFFRCYTNTYLEHGSTPYLNRAFFDMLHEAMPEALVLVRAERQGHAIASALLLRDAKTLYGRYWGALETVPCLHFETAYYTPMSWAIDQGIERFEGGAQGEHKLARGFLPVTTYSYHHLSHPSFAQAIERFLVREAHGLERYLSELEQRSPLKTGAARPAGAAAGPCD